MTEPTSGWRRWIEFGVTALIVLAAWAFLLSHFKPALLMVDTMDAGGDTPSFHRPIAHLKDTLYPAWNPLGWDLANFAGYAPYQYYFLLPATLVVLASLVVPFFVAFKLVSALGVFLLPLCTTLALRAMGLPFPVPAIGAAASLLFLYNEGNSMWGGNIPSTLAGEFAHSLSFALAILFMGNLYRGIERQRGWPGLGLLLALTGYAHPVGFLNAASAGIFFVMRKSDFVRNLRFLLLVYGTAVLLMGFWLVPLIAKIGFATSINWVWHFQSVWDVLPKILYPVFILAALDTVWVLLRRREADRPARYLIFTMLVTVVFFLNATEIGLPEIRFVPFGYVLAIFLALDFIRRVLPLHIASPLAAMALSAGIVVWVHQHTSFIPSWIKWNYAGVQSKAPYPTLKGMMKTLEGNITDPRVAYENSPLHDRFGSMRIFESMALLSGRATLEGVLLQTAVNSPYIYWLQSQVSKQGSGVIPGYSYPSMDMARATPRLALYNAHDMIAVTPDVKNQLAKDARWQRTFQSGEYEIYHLKDADPHYVRVPKFRPVRIDSETWKKDFHRWFAAEGGSIDVPLVAGHTIPEAEAGRFPSTTTTPAKPPREAITASCAITEKIDHLAIEFTTTCPGEPHVIAVSYFPNWKVEGARHVFLASPAFMLVYPEQSTVRLTYTRTSSEWVGILFTLTGILACAVMWSRPALGEPTGGLAQSLTRVHPTLVVVGVVGVLAATGWDAAHELLPQRLYQRGWKAFEKRDYATSERMFDWAMSLGGTSSTAADGAFFRAASRFRTDRWAEALEGYEHVVTAFPDSIWVAEAHYHVGLCHRRLSRRHEAAQRLQFVVDSWPGNRWAGFAQEQLTQMAAEPGGLGTPP